VTDFDEDEPGLKKITREIYVERGWGRGEYLGNPKPATGQLSSEFTGPGNHPGGRLYLQRELRANLC